MTRGEFIHEPSPDWYRLLSGRSIASFHCEFGSALTRSLVPWRVGPTMFPGSRLIASPMVTGVLQPVTILVGPRKRRAKKRLTLRVASTRTRSCAGKATATSLPADRIEVATLSFAANARARPSATVRVATSDHFPERKAEAPASAPASVHRWSSWRTV